MGVCSSCFTQRRHGSQNDVGRESQAPHISFGRSASLLVQQTTESSRLLGEDLHPVQYGSLNGGIGHGSDQSEVQDQQRQVAALKRIVDQTSEYAFLILFASRRLRLMRARPLTL